jgi:tetratricopeptide (TPR) repeat protein
LLADMAIPRKSAAGVPASQSEAAAWFDAEYQALISLVTLARPAERRDAQVWQLAWALENYLDGRGLWHESLAVHEAGLAAAQRVHDAAAQVVMKRSIARAKSNLGWFDAAAQDLRLVLEALADQPGSGPNLLSETHRQLSWIYEQLSDLPAALGEARRALDVHPPDSRDPARAFALNAVGYYEAQLGMYDAALERCTAATDLLADSKHYYGQADALSSLGLIYSRLGRVRLSVHAYREALVLYGAIGARYAEADTCVELGRTLLQAGRPRYARRLLESALHILTELGHERWKDVAAELAGLDRN